MDGGRNRLSVAAWNPTTPEQDQRTNMTPLHQINERACNGWKVEVGDTGCQLNELAYETKKLNSRLIVVLLE